jgi:8-oxo-dGTP pyrophosphatase MutT (NUDIX family)
MSWREIRPVALGAVWRDDHLLVYEDSDPTTGETFYRFLGGGVDFGEHSREAVVREFEEELGVTFEVDRCAGTFERVFEFDGEQGHEIWRVYEGTIAESWPYERDAIDYVEPDLDEQFTARWMDADRLRSEVTFYVSEVVDALAGARG